MLERAPDPARGATARVLIERRCEIYIKVAALIVDLQDALADDDRARVRYLLADLRRALRSGLAFWSDTVFLELERLEELLAALGDAGDGLAADPSLGEELEERLQLLHVHLARCLAKPELQDLEEILDLPRRMREKLAAEHRERDLATRRREVEDQCWRHENEAREHIAQRQYGKAVKALRKAIKLDGRRAVFHNDLGVVLSLLGRHEEAIACYETAVRLNEEDLERRTDEWTTSYYNLGIALRKVSQNALDNGQTDQALDRLRQARAAFDEFTRLNVSGPKVVDAKRVVSAVDDEIVGLEAGLEA